MTSSLRFVLLASSAAALFLLAPSTAQAQCKPGDVLIGEDADQYICREKGAYEGTAAQRYSLTYCRQKRLVAADQSAVSALDIALDAERFEMFADVARDKKADFENQVFNALLDQGLAATSVIASGAKSLNPWNVNQAADMLTAKGLGNPAVIAALRKIARTKDKPAMAAAYQELLREVGGARKGWSTARGIAKDPENAKLRLVVGALKVMQGNPPLGLAITAAEMGENLAYLYYLTGEVKSLAASSDEKLARLDTLGSRLRAHVDTMTTAKKAWRSTLGYGRAWPACP